MGAECAERIRDGQAAAAGASVLLAAGIFVDGVGVSSLQAHFVPRWE
jgi:hypothetical protein